MRFEWPVMPMRVTALPSSPARRLIKRRAEDVAAPGRRLPLARRPSGSILVEIAKLAATRPGIRSPASGIACPISAAARSGSPVIRCTRASPIRSNTRLRCLLASRSTRASAQLQHGPGRTPGRHMIDDPHHAVLGCGCTKVVIRVVHSGWMGATTDGYDGIPYDELPIEAVEVLPDQERHLARQQRTGTPHEVDIEPSWAVEAALGPQSPGGGRQEPYQTVDSGHRSVVIVPGGGRRPTRRGPGRIPGACYGTTRRKLASRDCMACRTATTTDLLGGTR